MAVFGTHRIAIAAVFALSAAMAATEALAQATAVTLSGSTYSQNFDGMTTAQLSAVPSGWGFFRSGLAATQPAFTSGSTSTSTTQYAGTVGTGVIGNTASGGAYLWISGTRDSSTDKAIGFLGAGSYPGASATSTGGIAILFGFTNTTGSTITNLDLAWDFEKYRTSARSFEWQFYTSPDGSTWTGNSSGNQSYVADSGTAPVNPATSINKTVSLGSVSIASGSSYYLRWSYLSSTGSFSNAQGLGVDNFSLTATYVPVAVDLYWDGGAGWTATAPGTGGTGAWADGSGSWDASKKAHFGGTAGTVTVGTVTASNGLVFTTSGYTLTGGTISLAAASSGINTITTGTDGTVTTTLDSSIAGSAGLMKMGGGTLVLGGANTFTGGLTIASGTLQVTSDSNLGDAAGSVTLNGTLQTTGNLSLGSGRAVSGGASLDIAPGTTLTVGGSYATNSTTLLNSGTLDLQGSTRSAGTLTFNTAAVVNGAGAISLTGITATAVTSGTAIINPAITFTSGDRTVSVGPGGTVVLGGDIAGTTGRIVTNSAGRLVVSGSFSGAGYNIGTTSATPVNGGTVVLGQTASSGTGQSFFNYGTIEAAAPISTSAGVSIGGREGTPAILSGSAITFSGSSRFFSGFGATGDLRLDVNNATTFAGVFGPTGGTAGTYTGVVIGGTGSLAFADNASALVDAIALQDTVDLIVSGTLGSAVTVGAGNAIGGDGTILGSLAFASGADFLFDPLKTLTVNGASVTFGGFGISDLIGFSAAIPDGTYTLIDGSAAVNTANLANLGAANAVDLGGGRSAYFETGSLVLQVVPEPSAFALAAAGLALASLRRLRRRI
jgi:hypothetical protein